MSENRVELKPSLREAILAELCKDELIEMFTRQKFWHAHHIDIVWRYNGEDRRVEGDWIKNIWSLLMNDRSKCVSNNTAEPGQKLDTRPSGVVSVERLIEWMDNNAEEAENLEMTISYGDLREELYSGRLSPHAGKEGS